MKKNKPKFSIFDLSDDQIESCFNGCSNVDMVRNLLNAAYNKKLNEVDEMDFAGEFAEEIKGYIAAEEGTDEWQESYDGNYEWGESIAENINFLVKELNK